TRSSWGSHCSAPPVRRSALPFPTPRTRDERTMTARVVIAAVILVAVGVVAWFLRRRAPDAPPRDAYPVPKQLDRADFPRPEAAWLVALFSSAACDSCHGLGEKLTPLESHDVGVCEIDAETRGELHRRYELAAIPTTVV